MHVVAVRVRASAPEANMERDERSGEELREDEEGAPVHVLLPRRIRDAAAREAELRCGEEYEQPRETRPAEHEQGEGGAAQRAVRVVCNHNQRVRRWVRSVEGRHLHQREAQWRARFPPGTRHRELQEGVDEERCDHQEVLKLLELVHDLVMLCVHEQGVSDPTRRECYDAHEVPLHDGFATVAEQRAAQQELQQHGRRVTIELAPVHRVYVVAHPTHGLLQCCQGG
mmetsp:Transcript_6620/g.23367  ORF Transcript_6620/g.23367 Transcript_6620/m.23367 type:complete len:227 (-) Transcript_6620:285-965(-)